MGFHLFNLCLSFASSVKNVRYHLSAVSRRKGIIPATMDRASDSFSGRKVNTTGIMDFGSACQRIFEALLKRCFVLHPLIWKPLFLIEDRNCGHVGGRYLSSEQSFYLTVCYFLMIAVRSEVRLRGEYRYLLEAFYFFYRS